LLWSRASPLGKAHETAMQASQGTWMCNEPEGF
jgi:hypothetical protein